MEIRSVWPSCTTRQFPEETSPAAEQDRQFPDREADSAAAERETEQKAEFGVGTGNCEATASKYFGLNEKRQ
jgi:hypothetical protein